ncbi:elongation factor-like GTPase 1 [Lepeophtheirus salmonis]|uniref:elongation factor-like GTPase 1 n=1 Tax=Lepeophtheirus salmonis TaxID=72036 RepID=UPI001AE84635|nr:elongation factor-like GTPase 1 [Lepeophtheirus salmonis]
MPHVLTEKLKDLQGHPNHIRNICILAHVDHGKTTLADSLLACNGIISQRLSGTLRYLDSRPDEQARGITMKSSAVSLYHENHLINLIDSPGHVDFSSEVCTAVRLSDGALVLIDVVESVQPQTRAVLKQAWVEGIKPILVLNKMDRLILETQMSPLDAYVHLTQIIEQANAIIGELFSASVLEGEEALLDDADDSGIYFSPDAGNVVFASAYHGWAFCINTFAQIYSKKLGFSDKVLSQTLWGDFYMNTKTQKIMKGALSKAKKPLFVQLILDNIWNIYETISRKDDVKLEKILSSLSLKVHQRDLRSTDIKQRITAVMGQWLPLSKPVLDTVVSHLPSPLQLREDRIEHLMSSPARPFDSLPEKSKRLKSDFLDCSNGESKPVIVFVSKMFPISHKQLPENRPRALTAEELAKKRDEARAAHTLKLKLRDENASNHVDLTAEQMKKLEINESCKQTVTEVEELDDKKTVFIAFARVYSGTLRPGSEIYVLGPKHDPSNIEGVLLRGDSFYDEKSNLRNTPSSIMKATVSSLYLLLGRDLEGLDSAPAGNVIGIGGLEDFILKSATLSSNVFCPPFIEMSKSSAPILRVALEPAVSSELNKLVTGLHLLNQADANVQILITDKGEHLLITAGEVHLERCLKDLRETYAGIDINVSEPIVAFRETIVKAPEIDMVNEQIEAETEEKVNNVIDIETPDKQSLIKMRAIPLPSDLIKLLDKRTEFISKVLYNLEDGNVMSNLSKETLRTLQDFQKDLDNLFERDELCRVNNITASRIWAFGPKKTPTNLLFNFLPEYEQIPFSVWDRMISMESLHKNYVSSFLNGFQLASSAGPLCDEPMRGVGFIVSEWSINSSKDMESSSYGPLSGQIISTVKEGCKSAFQAQPQRLMAGMYTCDIMVKAEVLGKMYAVLGKRHGKVVKEKMIEGSSTFTVTANLPVVESLNFCNVIRKQTSGLAMPQLVFSHWEIIDIDPFWVPVTDEELLHFGDKADSANIARCYMNNVRKRKGLAIDEKIVEHGEKQRTISKKK